MNPPFTTEQFMQVFENYNLAVWPFQVILNLFAVMAILFALKKSRVSDIVIGNILGFFWLWMGIVYHLLFFTAINNAAFLFGSLYIIQGLLFIGVGAFGQKLSYQVKFDLYGSSGLYFIIYALIAYPILAHNLGHIYPQQPTFGLPCPTTIFTFGLLLWSAKQIPKYILIIPFLWSLIGASAAITLSIKEDYGLLIAGLVGTLLILIKDSKKLEISQKKE